MSERLVGGGKMGQGILFFVLKNNKNSEAEAEKKTRRRLVRRRRRTIFSENVCQCVSPDQEKRFPWCLRFHCRTSIDGAKNNLWDVQSLPTSDKSQSRPQASGRNRMFINSASVTSVGTTQIIGNDWEITTASADLLVPSWQLTSWSPGDFDASGTDAAVGWWLELSFFCSPVFLVCFSCPQKPCVCVLVCLLGSDSLIYGTGCVSTVVTIMRGSHDTPIELSAKAAVSPL